VFEHQTVPVELALLRPLRGNGYAHLLHRAAHYLNLLLLWPVLRLHTRGDESLAFREHDVRLQPDVLLATPDHHYHVLFLRDGRHHFGKLARALDELAVHFDDAIANLQRSAVLIG